MVNQQRSSQKATYAKDVSPMRNTSSHSMHIKFSSSPSEAASSFGRVFSTSRLTVPKYATSNQHVAADKWKYNNMVTNNREQFNNMHFC